MMGVTIGTVLALAVSALAWTHRFDRERGFYPAVLIVVASYFVLFAVMSGDMRAVAMECAVMAAFVLCAVVGIRRGQMLVAAGLVAHGLQDVVHTQFIHNPGVPVWWPPFCAAFDVVAGGALAWMVTRPSAAAR